MADPVAPPLTLAELERIVREADPAAAVVPARIVRRVIKTDRGVTFLGWHGAHREGYAIAGAALRAIVEEDELGLSPGAPWPETVCLLTRPSAEELAEAPRAAVLARCWRLLFHARVHAALLERDRTGALDAEALGRRIAGIGRLAFEEARAVLQQDGRLLPPRDDRVVYGEFAAAYLELRHFAPALLGHEFPAIDCPDAIDAVLAQDVDGPGLFAATRLAGAPEPSLPRLTDETDEADDEGGEVDAGEPPEVAYRRLARRAEAAAGRGNHVRAALLWTRAAARGGPGAARRARAAARAEIERLTRRLQPAIDCDEAELDRWKRALPWLLDRAARGFWKAEARLLYDLQRAASEHERESFTVDLVEWARSRGRRPLKRPLPLLRGVAVSNHLHRTARRLPATRLHRDARERLGALLSAAVARAEQALREQFRPIIDETLHANAFRPRNLPERVAYHKLIEELLDRVVDRGFFTLGDLRDALSRSHIKLPDLSGPSEFFGGDRLLRTDVALAEALDGVYRRGEIYLRALQRVSAVASGTRWGRFLTLFVVLPYGGTFVGLKGLGHLLELVQVDVDLGDPMLIFPVGTLVLALVNSPPFRHEFVAGLGRIARAARSAVRGAWRWLARQPWVRAVVDSRVFLFVWRLALKPLALTVPLLTAGSALGLAWRALAEAEGALFVIASVVLNSRLGRDAEEIAAEGATRLWTRFWSDWVPGLFRWILMVFQQFLEAVERSLYAVDEWLRFRGGQPPSALAVRAVLGFAWFFVAYLVRLYANVLIEPQVNPIKHFPVVTVSHKIILPLSKTLTFLFAAPLLPLVGKWFAYFVAGTTVLLLPGAFGFLVWEMKENWRLYEANRAERLRPVIVGHHGETMARLLRPGFHSGTIPKLFARLRRAERRALEGKPAHGIPRRLDALEHVEHDVARFVNRDVLALLRGCRAWESGPAPVVRAIGLATNRVRVALGLGDETPNLLIAFEQQARGLTAAVVEPGWMEALDDARHEAVVLALRGLWTMSGVEQADGEAADDLMVSWSDWVDGWEHRCAPDCQPSLRHATSAPLAAANLSPGRGRTRQRPGEE